MYSKGQHNVISDRSGQKYKSGGMMFTWDGALVHRSEWEPKHPQIELRPREESPGVKDARPRQPDRFVGSIDKTVTGGLDDV